MSLLGFLHGIHAAVARDIWTQPDTMPARHQSISVEAAIWAVARNAVSVFHSEDEIGSLEWSKLFDLVLLVDDPRAVPPSWISHIRISEIGTVVLHGHRGAMTL